MKETNLDFKSLTTRTATDTIVLHHTGNPTNDDLSAAQIHVSHKAQGWSGIGYHYVIRKDGTIERGRPHWTAGAHAEGENWHTIGVHLCGNFEIAQPTDAQINSVSALLADICCAYGLPTSAIVGHRDLMSTACPGRNLYKLMQTIRGNAEWYKHNNTRGDI